MAKQSGCALGRRLAALMGGQSVLDGPLGRASNREIDAALERLGSNRAELFTPSGAIAPHRIRMAHMLAAHGVDVARAVEERWESLKITDHYCAYCGNTRRCRNWLEWGRRNDAPSMFCPNAQSFEAIATGQSRRDDLDGDRS